MHRTIRSCRSLSPFSLPRSRVLLANVPLFVGVLLCVRAPELLAADDLRTLVLHGQSAPGTPDGVTFRVEDGTSPRYVPIINGKGQVSFGSLLAGAGVVDDTSEGIWTETFPGGPLRLVARAGDARPGLGGTFGSVGSRHSGHYLTDHGETLFDETTRQGTMATAAAVWRDSGSGAVALAQNGDQIPGQAAGLRYGPVRLVGVGSQGHASWHTRIVGPGVTAENDLTVWMSRSQSSAVALLQREGPAAGTGSGVRAWPAEVTFNRYGDAALNDILEGPGLGTGMTGAIFARRNGVIEKVVFEREPAPGLPSGSQFGDSGVGFSWRTPSINSMGAIAFVSSTIGGNPIRNGGVWTQSPRGFDLVVEHDTPAPDRPRGTTLSLDLSGAVINDLGQVLFRATPFDGVSSNGSGDLFRATQGHFQRIAGINDPAPDNPGWVFTGDFPRVVQNNHGQVAFIGQIREPVVGGGFTHGLFAHDRSGVLREIARIGGTLEVAPGDFRVVRDLELATGINTGIVDDLSSYRQSGFSDTGHLAFRAGFTDGTAGFFVSDKVASDLIVPAGDVWKFRDDGVDLGTSWRQPTYDDSAWSSGPAQLGFGDNDEATVIDNGGSSPLTTAYFRKEFEVADPAAFERLSLDLLRDDGAAVYLNGVRVARDNLPAVFDASTPALAALASESERVWKRFRVNPNHLVAGTNVLAVEIHQSSPTSSDLSFDLRLYSGPGPIVDFGMASNRPAATFQSATIGNRRYQRATGDSIDEIAFHANAGSVVSYGGNYAFEVNNANVSLDSELIDVRHLRDAVASIDVRTWENSTGSDFEAVDEIEVFIDTSSDAVDFSRRVLVPSQTGGTGASDALKRLDNGQFGRFTTFYFALPEGTTSVRFQIRAVNDSASERFVFDNLRILGVPVPEPAGVVLVGVAVGVFIVRRGRNAGRDR